MLNLEFICIIGIVSSYLGNWGKRVNFSNGVAEIQQKYEREREKVGEIKFWISIITLPKFLLPKPANRVGVKCPKGNQLWQCHCQNMGKKIFVAMPLAKMGGKKINGCRNLGRNFIKKKVLRSQYFYNIFTTNHRWLVIISLNLNLTLRLLF